VADGEALRFCFGKFLAWTPIRGLPGDLVFPTLLVERPALFHH